jgi:hypothetical protein
VQVHGEHAIHEAITRVNSTDPPGNEAQRLGAPIYIRCQPVPRTGRHDNTLAFGLFFILRAGCRGALRVSRRAGQNLIRRPCTYDACQTQHNAHAQGKREHALSLSRRTEGVANVSRRVRAGGGKGPSSTRCSHSLENAASGREEEGRPTGCRYHSCNDHHRIILLSNKIREHKLSPDICERRTLRQRYRPRSGGAVSPDRHPCLVDSASHVPDATRLQIIRHGAYPRGVLLTSRITVVNKNEPQQDCPSII